MKMIVAVAFALVAVVAAAPVQDEPIPILKSDFQQQPEGGFSYGFETGNGIVVNANGELKEVLNEENKPQSVVIVRGSYSYPDENGKPLTVNYLADDKGYHPEADFLPKPASRR